MDESVPTPPSPTDADTPRSPAAVSRRRGRAARDQLLQLRCSAAERERWREKAEAASTSVSALLRAALDEARPRRRRRAVADPALLRELGRIGNNLNQLAQWANREKGGVPAVAVLARLVEIDRELRLVRESAALAAARAETTDDASGPIDAVDRAL